MLLAMPQAARRAEEARREQARREAQARAEAELAERADYYRRRQEQNTAITGAAHLKCHHVHIKEQARGKMAIQAIRLESGRADRGGFGSKRTAN